MQVQAKAKQVRISPRKLAEVAALVRGRSLSDGLIILEHTPRRAAGVLAQVINSAAANAENNHKLERGQLQLQSILVSPGAVFKRFRPGSRGHIDARFHRTSHITVVVSDERSRISDADNKKVAATTSKPGQPKERA